jgi:hypothetical protein
MCFFKKLHNGQSQRKEDCQLNPAMLCSFSSTHNDLAMQALVWLCMIWFKALQFGMGQIGTLH